MNHSPSHSMIAVKADSLMHMPRLTGLEAIRRVKAFQPILPCILISAQLDDEIRQAALEAHAYRVLPKPIGVRDLTAVVRQALADVYNWPVS